MKRFLLLVPALLLAACGGTPDVAPANDTAAPDSAMEAQPADDAMMGDDAMPTDDSMAADGGDGMMADDSAPAMMQEEEPTVVDEPAPADALPINYDASFIAFYGMSSIQNHEGEFKKFRAILQQEGDDWLTTKFRFDIDLRHISTDDEQLTAHLQKEDFFDTANYPVATFVSKSGVWPRDDGGFEIDGDLTIKGQTKALTATIYRNDNVLKMHLDVPRKEFGIGNDSYGDKVLDDYTPVDGEIVLE